MKKLLIAFAVTFITATSVKAQDNPGMTSSHSNMMMDSKKSCFSIGANVGAPLTSGFKIAVGGDLQADFGVSHGVKITASGGYENISYKATVQSNVTYAEGNFNLIPVLAGVKYYFSSSFYGHGQLGYTFSTAKGGGGSFTFAPSVGYNVSKNFDLALKYVEMGKTNTKLVYGSNSIGTLQLRLAYDF